FSSWSFSEDNGSVGDYDLPSADSLVARLGDKGTGNDRFRIRFSKGDEANAIQVWEIRNK
ncbi:MAG: hypothetical protein KBS83_01545, partial [Lachnospiraceae bacterium]|nr:hypothetical protein [Candidatus Equihabitans merdae]